MSANTMTLNDGAEPYGKTGIWWFLSSEIPTFGGVLVAYIVLRLGSAGWTEASSHLSFNAALINTFILLTSSMTIVMAHAAVLENDFKRVANLLGATVVLGLAFLSVPRVGDVFYSDTGDFSYSLEPRILWGKARTIRPPCNASSGISSTRPRTVATASPSPIKSCWISSRRHTLVRATVADNNGGVGSDTFTVTVVSRSSDLVGPSEGTRLP